MTKIQIDEQTLRDLLAGKKEAHTEAKKLLPKRRSLLGRWATHQEHGRVLCASTWPTVLDDVAIAFHDPDRPGYTREAFVSVYTLTFDPDTLDFEEELHDAPNGTVIESPQGIVTIKAHGAWHMGTLPLRTIDMEAIGPWKVVRWGGEEPWLEV